MVIVLKRKVKSVLGYFTSQRVVDIVITSAGAAAAIVDAHEHEHGAPHVHVYKSTVFQTYSKCRI